MLLAVFLPFQQLASLDDSTAQYRAKLCELKLSKEVGVLGDGDASACMGIIPCDNKCGQISWAKVISRYLVISHLTRKDLL